MNTNVKQWLTGQVQNRKLIFMQLVKEYADANTPVRVQIELTLLESDMQLLSAAVVYRVKHMIGHQLVA